MRALVQVQRAAAIIIENGCVLFAGNKNEDYYSIGGGVHTGESAESAVLQEVFEETGIHYEIERLAVIHENSLIITADHLRHLFQPPNGEPFGYQKFAID